MVSASAGTQPWKASYAIVVGVLVPLTSTTRYPLVAISSVLDYDIG